MLLRRGKNSSYVLTDVPADLRESLVRDHGWDVYGGNVFTTQNHYAALTFAECADADVFLSDFAEDYARIEASWSLHSDAHLRTTHSKSGMEFKPFQKAGVDYCLERTHSLIGDQPGCTKTAQAIAIANEILAKRVLVICPANIRLQWMEAIRDWSLMPGRFVVYPILRGGDGVHPRAEWTITSYDLLRNNVILNELKKTHYDLLILDEAHYLKSNDAKRTRAIFGEDGLSEHAEKVVALTGTPLPNRPRECYTLARGLDWSSVDYMSEDDFRDRFNPSMKMTVRTKENRLATFTKEQVGRLPELQSRLRSRFMVRRLKRDVLAQLPAIRYNIQHVEETGAVRKALEAERMLDIDPENMAGVDAKTMGHVALVRHEMGVAKAAQVAAYVSMLIDGGEEKILLAAWHIAVLDLLEKNLHKHGVIRIDGSVSPAKRQARVNEFQQDHRKHILLGNIQALGVGVDGVQKVCSRLVGAECSWVPSDNEQIVGRIERMGQRNEMQVDWMVAPGSFDEKVLGSSLRKLNHINAALDKEHH